ncbi:MAG TPA: T9SS type A sorting domain-containing protein [Chitinophagales bacterium]|nr:T9SS type A sorting domain-containing protein [Chitinophagales bacterium]
MKKNSSVLLLLFCCIINAFAQELLWNKCNNYAFGNNVVENDNGRIYIFSSADSIGFYNTDAYNRITVYDSSLQTIEEFQLPAYTYVLNFTETDNSYFVYTTLNDSTQLIKKYNEAHQLIWVSDTLNLMFLFKPDFKKLKNGNLLISDYLITNSKTICLSSTGNFLWESAFSTDYKIPLQIFLQYKFNINITENDSGTIMLVKEFYYLKDEFFDTYSFITERRSIDSFGQVHQMDTSYAFSRAPSDMDYYFGASVRFYTYNQTKFYPEFYSDTFYSRKLIYRLSDVHLNTIHHDTIYNNLGLFQENYTQTITDSTCFLFVTMYQNFADSNQLWRGLLKIQIKDLYGNSRFNYIIPDTIELHAYNGIIHQFNDNTFLVEIRDNTSKKIHQYYIDNFLLKWHVARADTFTKNDTMLYETLSFPVAYNEPVFSNPISKWNYKNADYYTFTNYIALDNGLLNTYRLNKINLNNGQRETIAVMDSFSHDFYGYDNPTNPIYAINYYRILPNKDLFISAISVKACHQGYPNSYLAYYGNILTSIKQQQYAQSGNLQLYPNPNNGNFSLNYDNNGAANLYLQVLDVSGKTVLEKQVAHQDKSEIKLNLSGLQKGIYWIKLTDRNEYYTKAVIIQ